MGLITYRNRPVTGIENKKIKIVAAKTTARKDCPRTL